MNFSLTTILLAVLAFVLIRFATKILMKLMGWLLLAALVLFLMFYFGIGPFNTNPIGINTLVDKYCKNGYEEVKCFCIVQPIQKDLEMRFTSEELEELRKDRVEMGYAVQKSFKAASPEITNCLRENNAIDQLDEFKKELIPIDEKWMERFDRWRARFKEKSQSMIDSLMESKRSIDERYQTEN